MKTSKKDEPKASTRTSTIDPEDSNRFPVVGIGASAGGLEAFEAFFSAMPDKPEASFIIVAHLDPSHSSLLPELIQKKTKMQVTQASDHQKVEPNKVYIIPPNKELIIQNNHLHLLDIVKTSGIYLPIDIFFRSLAKDQGSNAIGIVLSGTGSDGSLGIREIKGAGGIVMVQEPDTANYDGMPRSAISTGVVDIVLPPDQMPQKLIDLIQHPVARLLNGNKGSADTTFSALQKIYALLRASTQHDFSQYKQNTLRRRIERRMSVNQIESIDSYIRYLQESSREVEVLFQDLLINVTSFFRDHEAFDLLKDKYFPEMINDRPDNDSIRIWVPGCSSGEEAYSIAIALQEVMETYNRYFQVQIFATDIDEDAINQARMALYKESIATDVGTSRLKKFFTKEEDHYRIRKSIRDMVVFATQNVTKDPPFSKLDLISCRNLMIYFEASLQKKLLPLFHYSLKPKGLLFLGTSESIGSTVDLFDVLDKKWKIFQRQSHHDLRHPDLAITSTVPVEPSQESEAEVLQPSGQTVNTLKLLKSMLIQSNLPPSVVINDKNEIIYVHGRIGRYLEPSEGEANFDALAMARTGLKTPLRTAIRKVAVSRQEVKVSNIKINNNGAKIALNLTVRPFSELEISSRGLMLLLFEETVTRGEKMGEKPARTRQKSDEKVKQLEEELLYTRENLQANIEELEAANEELKSNNEELQSTNEELQSTNEELETSKEELQSLNEESTTVNNELQSRIDDLSVANDDMKNLLDSTNIATIFLDIDLAIRRYTPKATDLIPLTLSDIGRPLKHLSSELIDLDLTRQAQKVIENLEVLDLETESHDSRFYRVRIRPYRTLKNVIDGVVITFEDITELKKIDQERQLAAILKDSNDAITLQDQSGNIFAWNHGAEIMYGYTETEALKINFGDLIPKEHAAQIEQIKQCLKEGAAEPFITERIRKDGSRMRVLVAVTQLQADAASKSERFVTTEMDLDKLSEKNLQLLLEKSHERSGK